LHFVGRIKEGVNIFKKSFISISLSLALLLGSFSIPALALENDYNAATVSKALSSTNVNQLQAKGAILMDSATGTFILEQNSHERLPIASVTKVMSMLLIMEALDTGKIKYEDLVPISEHAVSMGGSQLYLDVREDKKYTVKDMLKGVAIHSSNDATVALAELIAGSEDAFVGMMNEKAKALGMNDTHFLDCSGLTDVDHYSSAYDVALMSRELITKHPKILEFTSIVRDKFGEGVREKTMDLDNTNKILSRYQGMKGLKTGSTDAAGYNLSAVADRSGLQLISVVLGEKDSNVRFAETIKLLDYGFANYETTAIGNKSDEAGEVEVLKGIQTTVKAIYADDVKALIKKGSKDAITKDVTLDTDITAPIKAGAKVGTVSFKSGDKVVGSVELVAANDVEKASFLKLFFRMIADWFRGGKK